MKYKPGDEVFIKAEITDVSDCSERPYFVAPDCRSINWVSEDKIIPMDKTYSDGLKDAWELARKLYCEHNDSERREILGIAQYETVLECMTPEEALSKIEAYEKEKEIKVGDVVKSCDEDEFIFAVAYITIDKAYCGILKDGGWVSCRKVKKTGKHIDIESLLRQIGE